MSMEMKLQWRRPKNKPYKLVANMKRMKHEGWWCMYMEVHKEGGKWAINACKIIRLRYNKKNQWMAEVSERKNEAQ